MRDKAINYMMTNIVVPVLVAILVGFGASYVTTQTVIAKHEEMIKQLSETSKDTVESYNSAASDIVKLKLNLIKYHPEIDVVSIAAAGKLSEADSSDIDLIADGVIAYQQDGNKGTNAKVSAVLTKLAITDEDLEELSEAVRVQAVPAGR